MGKNKPYILLGAAVFLALLVSVFTYGWLQKKTNIQAKTVEVQQVVTAARDVAWGTVLNGDMLKTAPFLRKSLPPGCFTEISAIQGRTVLYPVKAGEPVFESKLAPTTLKTGGVGAIISPQKRAMAVKVDKVIGVSGFVHPGNRVDVLVTLPKRGEQDGVTLPVTKTVLENLLVLATGVELEKGGKQEKAVQVDVITVEVTPEEAERLALAVTEGKIQMALRNVLDAQDVATRGSTIQTLLASYGGSPKGGGKKGKTPVAGRKADGDRKPKAAAESEKKPAFTVELIKGSAITSVKFERGGEKL
jgi:pilus assembly protein CpaB